MRLTESQIITLIVSGIYLVIYYMSRKMTPEEVLNSVVEGINAGDLDSLMTLYEPLACFASQPGELAKSPDGIQESLRGFIDMNGKLDLKVKRVLKASDLALVTTEWSFSGTGSDGKHVVRKHRYVTDSKMGKTIAIVESSLSLDERPNMVQE
jgi:ketosteroid isomerase-like protein